MCLFKSLNVYMVTARNSMLGYICTFCCTCSFIFGIHLHHSRCQICILFWRPFFQAFPSQFDATITFHHTAMMNYRASVWWWKLVQWKLAAAKKHFIPFLPQKCVGFGFFSQYQLKLGALFRHLFKRSAQVPIKHCNPSSELFGT